MAENIAPIVPKRSNSDQGIDFDSKHPIYHYYEDTENDNKICKVCAKAVRACGGTENLKSLMRQHPQEHQTVSAAQVRNDSS